jgi:hypothetical protein
MKRMNPLAILVLGGMPGTLWAHGGLEHASAFMRFLHSAAHFVNEHPVATALLGGFVVAVIGLRLINRRISP